MSAARDRAERYAAMAPEGDIVTVTDDNTLGMEITQVLIKGSIDTILVTVGSRPGRTRTRVTATWWFNSGSKPKPIKVGYLGHQIRGLYIDRRTEKP